MTSISVSLIVIALGMLLWATTKKENLGAFFRIMSIFITTAGFIILIFSCIHHFHEMRHWKDHERMENCRDGKGCCSDSMKRCEKECYDENMTKKCCSDSSAALSPISDPNEIGSREQDKGDVK